jgi:hypothetical protein
MLFLGDATQCTVLTSYGDSLSRKNVGVYYVNKDRDGID